MPGWAPCPAVRTLQTSSLQPCAGRAGAAPVVPSERCWARPWGQSWGWALLASRSRSPPLLQAGWGTSVLPSGAAGQKSLSAVCWGGAWYLLGETFPIPANGCLATAGPCPVPQRCSGLAPLPAQPVPQPWKKQVRSPGTLLPGHGSYARRWELAGVLPRGEARGLCLERVPLGGATQAARPWPWVPSPGEVWLRWGCCPPGLGSDESTARGGDERVAL